MKISFVIILLTLVQISSQAQRSPRLDFTDAHTLTLIGQAFPLKNSYYRIDTTAHQDFPLPVKRLLTNPAGMAISFTTGSPRIAARWCVKSAKASYNMTLIAKNGLDIYIKKNGRWEYAGVGRPSDSTCTEFVMVKDMDPVEKECLVYLPLYEELKSLSIGVDSGFQVRAAPDPFTKKRVIIYGSSITQGASASRPGLAYPAKLSRETGMHFINLGLSGNGKMEKEVADMLSTIQADAFVLDCFANPTPEQITERTSYLVKTIRARHPDLPIIFIQSIVRDGGNFDKTIRENVRRQNENALTEFNKLVKDGVKKLYLIKGDNLLGSDHETTTDGTHPNDLGFDRMLQVIKPEILKILK